MSNTNNSTSSSLGVSVPINSGDTTWILVSTALVMIMIPGLGFFYSGLARHHNALSLIFLCMLSLAVVSIQWFLFGYSLAFGNGSFFIGNFNDGLLLNMFHVSNTSSIPVGVFMIYQCMFAAITPALAFGSVAERCRIVPLLIFVFLWTTFVYDFIAYWTWGGNGWLHADPSPIRTYDYAGGTPVHIASASAGLALSIIVGKRSGYGRVQFKPHNISNVFLGTALLWFGWFGFNGGSELAGNARAVAAVINTNLAACSAGLTWVALEYWGTKKLSGVAFCTGAVAGLVCITPGSGFVAPYAAFIIGIIGTIACFSFLHHKSKFGFDDALDVFGVHGVGGIVGNLLTGIFASQEIINLDGSASAADGGWVDGKFIRLLYQLIGSVAGLLWSFCITFAIGYVMNKVPGLKLRMEEDQELVGLDLSEMGESVHAQDTESVDRLLASASPKMSGLNERPVVTLSKVSMSNTQSPAKTSKFDLVPGSVAE